MSVDEGGVCTPGSIGAAGAGYVVDYAGVFAVLPTPCVVLDTESVICEISEACLATVGCTRSDVVGREMFVAFPDSPNNPDVDGVRNPCGNLCSRCCGLGKPTAWGCIAMTSPCRAHRGCSRSGTGVRSMSWLRGAMVRCDGFC